jgi:hypothetical protein
VKKAESGKCRWDAQAQLFSHAFGYRDLLFAAARGSEEFQAAMEADNAEWLQAYNTQDAKTLGTMYGEGAINSMLFATVAEEPWRTDAAHSISQNPALLSDLSSWHQVPLSASTGSPTRKVDQGGS